MHWKTNTEKYCTLWNTAYCALQFTGLWDLLNHWVSIAWWHIKHNILNRNLSSTNLFMMCTLQCSCSPLCLIYWWHTVSIAGSLLSLLNADPKLFSIVQNCSELFRLGPVLSQWQSASYQFAQQALNNLHSNVCILHLVQMYKLTLYCSTALWGGGDSALRRHG